MREPRRAHPVAGEAADGHSAVDVVLRRRPDVVPMDVRMPELSGRRALRNAWQAVVLVYDTGLVMPDPAP